MGTHPIFESDFDCLTECVEKEEEMSSCQSDHDSDSDLELSVYAQAALAAFLAEQQVAEQEEEAALGQVESTDEVIELKEDWQLSQFWNDEATCAAFATIIKGELERRGLGATGRCVFLSSLTAFNRPNAPPRVRQ